MREIRTSGSEGGVAQTNAPFLPLSIGRPTRWVGAGFIPARTERIAALTSPLESLNLGGYYVRYVIGRFLPLRSNHVAGSMLHLS